MNGSKNEYINYRLSKSKEIFEDAILLADNQRWNSCVNRLYYSSFYLVSSLLIKQGVKSESHNGVKTQFNLHFIKSGKLDIKYGKLYSNLFHWRQESDYADFIDFDEETVKPLINEVIEFNSELMKLFD